MSRRLYVAVLIADLVWILISIVAAYVLRYGVLPPNAPDQPSYIEYSLVAVLALGIWIALYTRMKLDGFSAGWDMPGILSQVLIGVLLLMSIMLSTAFLVRQLYSRLLLGYLACLLLVGFLGIRLLVRFFIASRSRSGAERRVVIIGNDRIAREVANKIARHPELMKRVVGFLYASTDLPTGSSQHDVPAAATAPTNTLGIVEMLKRQGVEEIIVANPRASISDIQKLIHLTRIAGLRVSLVPQGYELYLSRASFLDVGGLPILSLEDRPSNPLLVALKRIGDIAVASLMILLASPILVVAAIDLILRGEKPFRRELRCGLNGKPFSMWRMNVDRDAMDLRGFRRWLSRLSFTELPQLCNVLSGDMSLVGPRPESPERVKHYSEWQGQRLSVKPGLTGLAQVHGLREQHASEEKARFDLQYILHWSPFLDLSLLLQTVWTVAIRLWAPTASNVTGSQDGQSGILTEVVNADRSHAGAD
jgi:lipopolysaccharide/colanic/teichoic acid biosynthesis glycosyltransferase